MDLGARIKGLRTVALQASEAAGRLERELGALVAGRIQ